MCAAAWILAVLAALSAAGALLVSTDRRRTARLLGIGLVAGGMIVVAFYLVGGAVAGHAAPRAPHAPQETPFRFKSATALTDPSMLPASCRSNRGPTSAPLFLVNHWVDTTPVPRASLAAIVNAREPLLARARACERIRHRLPNLVAVDFYRRGDLLGVVNTLNGVG